MKKPYPRFAAGLVTAAALLLVVVAWPAPAAGGAPAPAKPAISKRFKFLPGQRLDVKANAGPLSVEWVRVDVVPVRTAGSKNRTTQLRVTVHVKNPSDQEQRVVTRATFLTKHGRVLAEARGEDVCEDSDEDDLEVVTSIDNPLKDVAAFTLDLDSSIE